MLLILYSDGCATYDAGYKLSWNETKPNHEGMWDKKMLCGTPFKLQKLLLYHDS